MINKKGVSLVEENRLGSFMKIQKLNYSQRIFFATSSEAFRNVASHEQEGKVREKTA